MILTLSACSNSGNSNSQQPAPSEDYFSWDGTTIIDLTDEGKKQTELIIPAKATAIKQEAFKNNLVIQKISFGGNGNLELPLFLFSDCASLASVSLPEGMTTLNDDVFTSCASLKDVFLPDSLETIGKSSFNSCTALTAIDLKNVKNIGESAFRATGLKEVTLPSSVETVGRSAFGFCAQLEKVTFLGGGSLGTESFRACKKLKEAILPDTVTYIGYNAFLSCEAMEIARVPASVTDMGAGAFAYCENIKTFEVKKGSYADLEFDKFGIVDRENKKKTYY